MRGLSTTALLLAVVLEGSFASDETEITLSSAPADTKLGHDAGDIIIKRPGSPADFLQDTIVDEIQEYEFSNDENEETGLEYELSYLEHLESMVKEFQMEIAASQDRLREISSLEQSSDDIIGNCNGSPGCIVKSAFRKSLRFITSLGSETADDDGKGRWHWPGFPFPHHGNHTHHGYGNHTHGNHTFPPHFPHHGNHTHGNHTHGNHTHPPHHPPFRLPPHFCRPPHHGPPHKPPHKKPHHPPHPPPPGDGSPEPPHKTPEGVHVYVQPTTDHPIHYPLAQITITPAKLLISALLGIIFLRIFHGIRRRRMSRRLASSFSPYNPSQAGRKTRFHNFVNRLRLFSKQREQNDAPPLGLHHEHGDEKVFAAPVVYFSDYCDEEEVREKGGYLDCGELDEKKVGEWDEKQGGENRYDYCDEKMGEVEISSVSEELASFRSVADLVCDMVVAAEEGRAVRGVPGEVGPGGTWKEGS